MSDEWYLNFIVCLISNIDEILVSYLIKSVAWIFDNYSKTQAKITDSVYGSNDQKYFT